MDNRAFWTLTIMLSAAVLCLCFAIIKAFAHDWYPIECCHAMDCAPVDHVRTLTRSGRVVVLLSFMAR
jgi:hypothetical protein